MCMAQNYSEWEERLEDGEPTFCIGCACNHVDDTEHKVVSIDGSKPVTPRSIEEGDGEKKKHTDGPVRKIAVAVAVIVATLSATGFAIVLCHLM